MKHIVSLSGGKDSTLMLLLMLEKGMPVDEIIYLDPGIEWQVIKEYLDKIEEYTGRKITRLKGDKSFDDFFFASKVKGEKVGTINAFPIRGKCDMNKVKMKTWWGYLKKQKDFVTYIGIAFNEPKRYKKVKTGYGKRGLQVEMPLFEWKIREIEVLGMLKERGMYCNFYDHYGRGGCYICPNLRVADLRIMRKHYPYEWGKILYYGEQAEKNAPAQRFAEFKMGYTISYLEELFRCEDEGLPPPKKEPWKLHPEYVSPVVVTMAEAMKNKDFWKD
jgi:3'-phosphoadenosine 5'-phosphosulfate sulfotransferase (PAPS reductase)/FAD synthetase